GFSIARYWRIRVIGLPSALRPNASQHQPQAPARRALPATQVEAEQYRRVAVPAQDAKVPPRGFFLGCAPRVHTFLKPTKAPSFLPVSEQKISHHRLDDEGGGDSPFGRSVHGAGRAVRTAGESAARSPESRWTG